MLFKPDRYHKTGVGIFLLILCLSLHAVVYGQQRPTFTIDGVPAVHNSTLNICQGARLNFANTTPIFNIAAIRWRFANGNPVNVSGVFFAGSRFDSLGQSKAVIIVTDVNGRTDSSWVFLNVSNVYPVAGFSFVPTTLECGSSNYTFTDTSKGNGLRYRWLFGDGRTSAVRNPVHVYDSALGATGNTTYTINQIVTNNAGCSDTAIKNVTVRNVPDIRVISADPLVSFGPFNGVLTFRYCNNVPNFTFAFQNQSTTINNITGYKINWGDGSPDTSFSAWPASAVIRHTYPIGSNTMTVEVMGANGCPNTKRYNIFVGSTPAGGFASPGNTEVCAPDTLDFNISGISNNPPGTVYNVIVNDGTPIKSFVHPAPAVVSHLFEKSSCGILSSNGTATFTNSFFALLNIENPCGTTSVNVIPIYVSGKPNPAITVNPSADLCVGTNATIRNTGNYGGLITSTGGGGSVCENRGKIVWTISPSTGYTISGGNFGSRNNSPVNGINWTSGSESFNINFSAPGIYTVWQYMYNERCGIDSVGTEICVRNPPVGSFTMNRRTGCAPDTLALTNTSPKGPCSGETYLWTVRYLDPLNCSGTPEYSFVAGTTDRSENPRISFTRAGQYIIELLVSARASTCSAPLVRDTFTVREKPIVTMNAPPGICAGNSITPVATVNSCYAQSATVYSWDFAGGNPVASNSLNPGAVLYANQGSFPIIFKATNDCGTTEVQRTLVVGSRPVANAGADREVCSNQQTTIGVAPATGVTYTWTPATGLAFPNQSTTTVNRSYNGPSNDTVYQYVLRASLGPNCESTDTVLVIVKKGPVLQVIPGVASICIGGSAVLTASGADTYSWTPAAGLNNPASAVVIASPASTTSYVLTGSFTNGCSATITVPVTVLSRPAVNAGRDTIACNNAPNVTLSGSPTGGVWSGSAFVTAAGIFNPRAAGNGSYKLFYAFTASGCDGIDSMIMTVQNPPPANAGSDTSLCADGSTLVLTGSPAGGTWSGSPLVSAGGNFTASTAGIYQLIYSRGAGSCIGRDTVTVTVVAAVSNNTITASQGVCGGATPAPLTGSNATAGGLTITYQWQSSTDSLSWTNLPGQNGKDYVVPVPAQNIFYRRLAATSVCNAGSPSNVVKITIHPDARAEMNPAPLTGCVPFALTPSVMNLVPYADRNMRYNWYVNNTLIGSGESFPGYTITRADDSVIVKLVAISRFGCKNDSVSTMFKTVSNPTPTFTLSDTVGCGPLNINIVNTTSNPGRYSFYWDFGTGQQSTVVQPGSIVFPVNPNRGDTIYPVVLKATGGCDTFNVIKYVRVRARPRTLFTPDKAEGCSPFTATFNNNSAGSNASFTWDFGDGSPRVPGNTSSISHTYFTGRLDTFRVRLFGTNDCGTDTANFALVVNPNVVRLDFAVNGDELNGCAPHTVSFFNNTTGANFFRWNFGDGSPELITNRGFDTVVHTFVDTGRYVVTLFGSNGCSDTSSTEVINVALRPAVSFTALPAAICLGDNIVLNNTSDTGLAFVWDFGDGTTSAQRAPVKVYQTAGTYRIVLRGSRQLPQGFGCTDSAVATVVVSAPTGVLNYLGDYYCEGRPVNFEITNTNATRFVYRFGNGDSLVSGIAMANYLYLQPGNFIPSVLLSYQGCSLLLSTGDTIKADRIDPGFLNNALQQCGSTQINFTDTSRAFFGISGWSWQFGDGTGSAARSPQKIYRQNGTYPVTLQITGNSGCTDSARLLLPVFVEQFPSTGITGDTTACIGIPSLFTANDAGGNATVFNWQPDGGVPVSGNILTQTWFTTGNYRVRLIALSAFGCADTADLNVRVNPSPVVNAGNDVTICRGQSIQLNARSSAPLNWTPQQGLSCADCANPIASPNLTTQYVVSGTNTFGCTQTDTLLVSVAQPFTINVTPNDTLCASNNESAQLFASNAHRYQWNPAVGLSAADIPNPVARPASTTTYRVIGFDAENCFADTAFVTVAVGYNPTVTLAPGSLVVAGTEINMQPSITGGPFKRYTWTPDRDLSCNNCPNPVATINNNIQYRLEVETIYGCTASDTTNYTVQCQQDQVFIPNAFSPDGDGINDVLMVRGKGVATVKSFRIFNRFGQVVFEKQNFSANDASAGWDGKVNGVPASPDVYVFTAEVLCTAGANYTYKGNVTLFR
jgi:large repetitive protein